MKHHTITSGQQPGGGATFTVTMPPLPLPSYDGAREPLLTGKQVAAFLAVSTRHLYSWRMAGFLPYYKIGRAVRFRLSEVLQALEAMRVRP